jgi:hypothetical protein
MHRKFGLMSFFAFLSKCAAVQSRLAMSRAPTPGSMALASQYFAAYHPIEILAHSCLPLTDFFEYPSSDRAARSPCFNVGNPKTRRNKQESSPQKILPSTCFDPLRKQATWRSNRQATDASITNFKQATFGVAKN